MNYYVIAINNGKSFDIVKVLPPDEANFLKDYGHTIQAYGTNLAELLHRFASHKASEWLEPLPIAPKLTKVKKRFPNHQLIRIQAYYRDNVGWITCGNKHPETDKVLSWLDQLKIALMAGATKCRLALSHKTNANIRYAEFDLNSILE